MDTNFHWFSDALGLVKTGLNSATFFMLINDVLLVIWFDHKKLYARSDSLDQYCLEILYCKPSSIGKSHWPVNPSKSKKCSDVKC